MSRAIKVIFTVSILGNLFLLGIVGGHIYRTATPRVEAWKDFRKDLSPDTRDLMRQKFKGGRKDVVGIVRDVRQKRKALEGVFTAEKFDPQEYDRIAQELSSLGQKIAQQKLRIFRELAMELPQEERIKISKKLASVIVGRHGGKHGYKKEHTHFKKQYEQAPEKAGNHNVSE